MVVGVDRLDLRQTIASVNLDGAVADHLVDIHVAARATAGLEDIDRKFGIELAGDYFFRRVQHRLDLTIIERVLAGAGELPEISIGNPTRVLDHPHGANHGRWKTPAADRKVFDRPLSLSPIIRAGRNVYLTHRVAFGTVVGHGSHRCWEQIGDTARQSTTRMEFVAGALFPSQKPPLSEDLPEDGASQSDTASRQASTRQRRSRSA